MRQVYFGNIRLTLLLWVFFNYFIFLPMLEWSKLGLLLFRIISSNGQLTKHSSNGINCFRIVFIQKRCCLNIYLVGRLLFFALIWQHLAFVIFFTFLIWQCQAKCLTFENSDFTSCANAQNIILHIAEKSDK